MCVTNVSKQGRPRNHPRGRMIGTMRLPAQATHCVGVDIRSIPKGIANQRPLNGEAEFCIEPDGGFVVSVDFKLQAYEVQPAVAQIDCCLHQGATNALSLPVIAYRHADLADMAAARRVGKQVKPKVTYHFTLCTGQQHNCRVIRLKLLPPVPQTARGPS